MCCWFGYRDRLLTGGGETRQKVIPPGRTSAHARTHARHRHRRVARGVARGIGAEGGTARAEFVLPPGGKCMQSARTHMRQAELALARDWLVAATSQAWVLRCADMASVKLKPALVGARV